MEIVFTNRDGVTINKKLTECDKKDLQDGNKLEIPEGVTEIGQEALNCFKRIDVINLQIKIPSTVTTIEPYAFACLHIQNIKLPEHLKEIGYNAFADTTFLSKVKIPSSVVHIPDDCFEGATFSHGIELPQ